MIETKCLNIHVATQNEMEEFISIQNDDVLKESYTEMLNGSLQYPNKREWYAIWMIELKDGTHIGEACFLGLNDDGIAEIGYGINENYRGKGYATEAVKAITEWALKQPCVKEIEAEANIDNKSSQRVLEKCGFVLNGKIGEEGPRYIMKRILI